MVVVFYGTCTLTQRYRIYLHETELHHTKIHNKSLLHTEKRVHIESYGPRIQCTSDSIHQ